LKELADIKRDNQTDRNDSVKQDEVREETDSCEDENAFIVR
jgi:hypothetical protein